MKRARLGLFAKILIWFTGTILIVVAVIAGMTAFERDEAMRDITNHALTTLQKDAALAVQILERNDASGTDRIRLVRTTRFWLFDGDGRVVLRPATRPGGPPWLRDDGGSATQAEGPRGNPWTPPDAASDQRPGPPPDFFDGRPRDDEPDRVGPLGPHHGFGPPWGGGPPRVDVGELASAAVQLLATQDDHALVTAGDDVFLCCRLSGSSRRLYAAFVPLRPKTFRLFARWIRDPSVIGPLLAIAGVIGVLCWWLARYLVTPIIEMQRVSRSIADGNLHMRLPEPLTARYDELGALAGDFNRMADNIGAMIDRQRQLLRDVSHELRSPLGRIQIALELLRQRENPESAKLIGKIDGDVARLNNLIQQILDLSRFEQLKSQPLATRSIDLISFVRALLADVRFEADLANKRLIEEFAPGPFAVAGIEELLRRAIENILRNAVRHTPPGSAVIIAIGPGPTITGQPGSVIVKIRDSGPGVSPADLPKLFEPFFRCEDDRSRHSGGIGLGLAIVKRAVDVHGGTVEARNHPAGGLELVVQLPTTSARATPEGAPESTT